MSSALEIIRQLHEDIERAKNLASCALQSRPSPTEPHERIAETGAKLTSTRAAEQLARDLVSAARQKSTLLQACYEDADASLQRDKEAISAPDPLSAFYARLRELRDVHRSVDALAARSVPTEKEKDSALITQCSKPPPFSGEEGSGRYMDLLSHYTMFLNLVKPKSSAAHTESRRIEYYEYVQRAITDFDSVPAAIRNGGAYSRYLSALLEYIVAFADKAYPLDRVQNHILEARRKIEAEVTEHTTEIADRFPSTEALIEGMEADQMKSELLSLGLKCGGRPEDRAKRLLVAARAGQFGDRVVLERLVNFALTDMLADERAATVGNIQKKLSLSYAEIEAERIADEAMEQGALDAAAKAGRTEEKESTLYNPKDVPLGWDGKPIPYWMYKLHGLNHEFKCEICGNAVYKGPRAFERHFTDTQHVQGLRCLGIGYSKEYMMITKIKDVNALHEKLKKASRKAMFDEDIEMEFEDRDGNVLNKKTYNDLARQGLL